MIDTRSTMLFIPPFPHETQSEIQIQIKLLRIQAELLSLPAPFEVMTDRTKPIPPNSFVITDTPVRFADNLLDILRSVLQLVEANSDLISPWLYIRRGECDYEHLLGSISAVLRISEELNQISRSDNQIRSFTRK